MKKRILIFLMVLFSIQGCSAQSSGEVIDEYIKNAESFYNIDDYAEAAYWMDCAINEAGEQYGEESQRTAELYLKKAELTCIFEVCIDSLQRAEYLFENLNDKEGIAKVYYKYGDCYHKIGNSEQAIKYFKQTIESCNDLGEGMNELQFDACLKWALCETDPRNSLELYEKAEELLESLSVEKQREEKIELYYGIGYAYDDLEQYEETIKYCGKAIECYEEGRSSIQTLIAAYHMRGYANMWLGNTEQAVEDTMKAKELIEEKQPDIGLWGRAIVYLKLAIIHSLAETPDYDKALKFGLDACRIYTEQRELDEEGLESLKSVKETFQIIYDHSPYAREQDFDDWYQENINK